MADIRVPTLGELVTEATIGKWFKKPGDPVAVDEPLVELETDKVTIEVPSPAAGVLADIAAKDGETVAVGALLGQIKEGARRRPRPAAPTPSRRPRRRSMPRRSSPSRNRGGQARAAAGEAAAPAAKPPDMPMPPSVRKLAAESGMDAGDRARAPARTAASPRAT